MDFELLQEDQGKVLNAHFGCTILTKLYHYQIRAIRQICQDPRDIKYFGINFKCLHLEKLCYLFLPIKHLYNPKHLEY